MSENATKFIAAFAIISVMILGFYLVLPSSYETLNATDLGAGNETLDDAYRLMLENQSIYGWLAVALAAFAIVSVVYYLARGGS